MTIDFPINEKTYGEYCPSCHANQGSTVTEKIFTCNHCSAQNDRLIIIDPKLHWWLDEEDRYYHESAGILLIDPSGKVLFYELTKFPYGLTIPAGHVDNGESALAAAIREAREEAGIDLVAPKLIAKTAIHGDKCRRGADDHEWSLFAAKVTQEAANSISIDAHEGQKPQWLDISEVDPGKMPFAMSFLFSNYGEAIREALNNQTN